MVLTNRSSAAVDLSSARLPASPCLLHRRPGGIQKLTNSAKCELLGLGHCTPNQGRPSAGAGAGLWGARGARGSGPGVSAGRRCPTRSCQRQKQPAHGFSGGVLPLGLPCSLDPGLEPQGWFQPEEGSVRGLHRGRSEVRGTPLAALGVGAGEQVGAAGRPRALTMDPSRLPLGDFSR